MKKVFTLIAVALAATSVNAQSLPENVYPYKTITWGDITWKNGNNKKDKDNKDMFFLMGTGNGYENVYCEYFVSEDTGNEVSRPYYTYVDYENGDTGIPSYGLYYKFTPSASGVLKVNVWVNKGSRKTFVVDAATGAALVPWTDYTFDGYVNGQNTNTDQPKIDETTGEQAIDNDGNPVWVQAPKYFTAEEMQARSTNASKYVIDAGNQAVWGWLNIKVEAGKSYVVYQQTSQIGFGGFQLNDGEIYFASPAKDKVAAEFAAVVDADGKATNVTDKGSVVTFTAAGVEVEAVGSSVPTDITPELDPAGISSIDADKAALNEKSFNLAGQQVNNNFRGIVIKNGKKFIK